MSEPEVEWYINRIKIMLGEIDTLVLTGELTNAKREIISSNTNEIEINLHTIVRKLKNRILNDAQRWELERVLEKTQPENFPLIQALEAALREGND